MNGWHRLWIFLTLTYGAVLGVFSAHEITSILPAFDASTLQYVSNDALLALNAADPYFGIGTPVEKSDFEDRLVDGIRIQLPSKMKEDQKNKVSSDLALAARKQSSARRFAVVRTSAILWLASSFSLLLIGHGVAWVARGFKGEMPNSH